MSDRPLSELVPLLAGKRILVVGDVNAHVLEAMFNHPSPLPRRAVSNCPGNSAGSSLLHAYILWDNSFP